MDQRIINIAKQLADLGVAFGGAVKSGGTGGTIAWQDVLTGPAFADVRGRLESFASSFAEEDRSDMIAAVEAKQAEMRATTPVRADMTVDELLAYSALGDTAALLRAEDFRLALDQDAGDFLLLNALPILEQVAPILLAFI